MKHSFSRFLSALLITLGSVSQVSATIGIGVHYGMDYSLKMPDTYGDKAVFEDLKVNASSFAGAPGSSVPAQFSSASTITGADLPIFVDRKDWKNTGVNFGGKLFIDIIPFLDAIEVSGNLGIWEYHSQIRYPKSLAWHDTTGGSRFMDYLSPQYDSTDVTLESVGLGYWGLKKTPYTKFNVDLTIRKYLVQFPKPLKTLRIYGGGGFSVFFATPVVSASLIEKAIGSELNQTLNVSALGSSALFDNREIMKKVLEQITEDLFTPHYGCHIDLGTMVKIPILPIGVYVDGKFYIPFGDLDTAVDVGGLGLGLNAGVALYF